ncbi:hypothetical protein DYBT9275_05953 [Dyadobacter sp. CECT 9275]|uniref:Uncharacterized protein n=1 Tax=Dyadobacter helix TaxID=2822344 RepID=A0A916JHR4_9BACT|nr:hypothetical protein [Dyadobacter sp. CECT 9275]CAG5018196.1 hypothetical protein DYBT9275_05953 [Dyadobacter sp. CECT 9275]
MKQLVLPTDDARITFTDFQGVSRKGMYKEESNGYVEISEVAMPEECGFLYPVNEIASWEYTAEDDMDLTRFIL